MFKGKISIIGSGFVGATTAYTIALSGLVSELVLVDINIEKAEGDVMDMSHGSSFISPVKITAGGYDETAGSDLIIISAGAAQKPGESRVDLLKRNTSIFKNIIDSLMKYCGKNTILLVITNPVDILTYVTLKLSGFDKSKVIGSGTVLDSARLKYMIGERVNVDVRNVHTYVIGEHGDTEVPAWSHTSIAGIKFEDYCRLCNACEGNWQACKDELFEKTKNAAYEIIEKKGATYYAVALAVRRIVECIIGNENSILTVSSYFDGQYGISDICLSVPSIVNSKGVDKILEVPFSEKEIKELKSSADMLKGLAREIGL